MMTGFKTFRLVPFCLLLLTGNVFAAGNGSSGDEISAYARILRDTIQVRGRDAFNDYKGKQCVVSIHLDRDGSLLGFNTEGGSPDLCNKLSDVLRGIKNFPAPPSDAVYQKIKDARMDFKL